MSESNIQNEIIRDVSAQTDARVFRTNSGRAWQGDRVWDPKRNQYILTNLRPYKGLPEGFSDLLMILPKGVTVFAEVKTQKGRTRPAQDRFLEVMRSMGHKTLVARSAEEAVNFIKQHGG